MRIRITQSLLIFFFGAVSGGTFFAGISPASAACGNPGEVLNLTNWKQTLPTGSKKKPTEIKESALKTFSHDIYFRLNEKCDGVAFRAPVSGVTTSNSGYPRSELREMDSNGSKEAKWSTKSGTHTMMIDQAITAVPKAKKHVVAGQIHDKEDDVMVIRLEHPKLFIDVNGKAGPTLDPNYTLGKRFNVKFVATGGKIKVYYNGSDTPVHTLKKKTTGNYFKAGAYAQSNCSKEKVCNDSNFGEVVIYKLLVEHQDANDAATPSLAKFAAAVKEKTQDMMHEEKIRAAMIDYKVHHQGFREQLLEKLTAEAKPQELPELREKIARGIYTLLPDIHG